MLELPLRLRLVGGSLTPIVRSLGDRHELNYPPFAVLTGGNASRSNQAIDVLSRIIS